MTTIPSIEIAFDMMKAGGIPANWYKDEELAREAFRRGADYDSVDRYNCGYWVEKSDGMVRLWKCPGKFPGKGIIRLPKKLIASREG